MSTRDILALALLIAGFAGIAWALCRFALHGYWAFLDARRQRRMRSVFAAELAELMASDPSLRGKDKTYTLPVWRSR